MSQHVMLDLETLGTKPGAVILSLGAVRFNPELIEPQDEYPSFNAYFRLDQQTEAGAHIDPDTVCWWMGQDALAKKIFGPLARQDVVHELQRFMEFARNANVWARDPNFDCVLLRDLAARFKVPVTWKYWQEYSCRTVELLAGKVAGFKSGVKHDALDDARTQAETLQHQLAKLRKLGQTGGTCGF